jgi:hypothetical protein
MARPCLEKNQREKNLNGYLLFAIRDHIRGEKKYEMTEEDQCPLYILL